MIEWRNIVVNISKKLALGLVLSGMLSVAPARAIEFTFAQKALIGIASTAIATGIGIWGFKQEMLLTVKNHYLKEEIKSTSKDLDKLQNNSNAELGDIAKLEKKIAQLKKDGYKYARHIDMYKQIKQNGFALAGMFILLKAVCASMIMTNYLVK